MEPSALPPHVERMSVEYSELHDRTSKARDFIAGGEGPIFMTLPPDEQWLMNQQVLVMMAYLNILKVRLHNAIAEHTAPVEPTTEESRLILPPE